MSSVVVSLILLVVMVTTDVTASVELSWQNDTDVSNSSDVSGDVDTDNITDVSVDESSDVSNYTSNSTDASNDVSNLVAGEDTNVPSTQDVGGKQETEKVDAKVAECTMNSEQYDNLNEKLMEIELQLELLQTAVDRIEVRSESTGKSVAEGSLRYDAILHVHVPKMMCL